MNVKEIVKTTLNLVVFCAIVGFLLSFYNGMTSGPIAKNKREEIEKVQKKLLKADKFETVIDSEKEKGQPHVWKAVKDGKLVGYVVKTQASGYSSSERITIMYSLNPGLKVMSVNIVSQGETPGLGTKVEENVDLSQFGGKPFVAQFDGKGVSALKIGGSSKPGKDYIAAITGATVSSRGVTKGIHDSLEKVVAKLSGGKKTSSGKKSAGKEKPATPKEK